MQLIFLEILHIGQHPIKILESNLILVAPNNSANLPHVLTRQRQGRPILPILWAYNLCSTYSNAMKLDGNEKLVQLFLM